MNHCSEEEFRSQFASPRSASRRPIHGSSHFDLSKYSFDLENILVDAMEVENKVFKQNVCISDSKLTQTL
jgi:hypothetical protein